MITKETRTKIIIAGIIVAVILFAYIFVAITYKPQVELEETVYPTGIMSESIFELQNMDPMDIDDYVVKYQFESAPVNCKLPKGTDAIINGNKVVECGTRYIFVGSVDNEGNLMDSLKKTLTPVISVKADEKQTEITILNQEDGYINGCSGTSYIVEVLVDGQTEYYGAVYCVKPDESICGSNGYMICGCIGLGNTTEHFKDRYIVASSLTMTMGVDKERVKEYATE